MHSPLSVGSSPYLCSCVVNRSVYVDIINSCVANRSVYVDIIESCVANRSVYVDVVTCQPFVGLRNGEWLGSRPVNKSSAQPR
jgi:hypothetical protein